LSFAEIMYTGQYEMKSSHSLFRWLYTHYFISTAKGTHHWNIYTQ